MRYDLPGLETEAWSWVMHDPRKSAEDLKTVAAWDVLRARRAPHPPNPLRYSHNFRYAIAVVALAIALTFFVFPARSVEAEMLRDTNQAQSDGFPDLPPAYGVGPMIEKWVAEWNARGFFIRVGKAEELAQRVGEYGDDSAVANLGVSGSLFALILLSAIAFGRAQNNLYALGYGASRLSPAWGFVSWFLPVLGFVLPWRIVSETVGSSWLSHDQGNSSPPLWVRFLTGLWGIVFLGLWFMNPVAVTLFFPKDDIAQWIRHIEVTEQMLMWLPVPAIFTALMLVLVSVKQHARYRELDRLAAARS